MAKLISPLKVRGTIDGLSFCLQQDGTVTVQAKPGPRPEQVKTGKNFALTRRNASEFGKVTCNAMLLRHALGYLKRALRDRKLNSHVIERLHPIAMSDTISTYGSRHANKGNFHLLEGFDFNHLLSLETALPVKLEHAMDMASGALQLRVRDCIVRRKKVFPAGATHFKLVSCAAAVDFEKHHFSNNIAESELLPLSKQMPGVELQHSLVGKPGELIVHTVGIVFYKVSEGKAELLKGGALQIVEVARVEEVMELGAPALAAVMPELEMDVPALAVAGPELEIVTPVSEINIECLETDIPALATTTVRQETATLSFTTVIPIQAIGKVPCAPCILLDGLLLVREEEQVGAMMQEVSQGVFEGDSPEMHDFSLGITDAMGVPLQDEEMQQAVIEYMRESRKRSKLKYLGRRLE